MTRHSAHSSYRRAITLVGGLALFALALGAVDPVAALAQGNGDGKFQISDLTPEVVDDVTGGIKDAVAAPVEAAASLGGQVLAEALEWLLGGLDTVITLWLVKFLVTIHVPVEGPLAAAAGPLIVIGGFFLVVGLFASVADGYREIIAGTDTSARVIGQAMFRVIGLAVLLGAWPTVIPLAIDVANGMTNYVLSDPAVADAVRRTFAAGKMQPILWLLAVIFMTIALLILIVMKFVLAIAFACLFIAGPALIGFGALPGVGRQAVGMAVRGVVTLMLIPLAWTVVFVAWSSVSGGMFAAFDGGGVVAAVMGPGLFVAGLLVMLAVTKKLLSMARMGLHTSLPGAGLARSVINLTAARTLMGATGAAGAAGADAQGASQATVGAVRGGEGPKIASTGPPQRGGSQGGGAPEAPAQRVKRKIGQPGGGGGGGAGVDARSAREYARAQSQVMEDELTARDSLSILPSRRGVDNDQRPADRVPQKAREALLAQAKPIVETYGGRTDPAVLQEKTAILGGATRSVAARTADAALKEHPDDPAMAQYKFSSTMADRFAGRTRSPAEEAAAATVIATAPRVISDSWAADRDLGAWREPTASTSQPGTTPQYKDSYRDMSHDPLAGRGHAKQGERQ